LTLNIKHTTSLAHTAQFLLIWMILSGLHLHNKNYHKSFLQLNHSLTWLIYKLTPLNLYSQLITNKPTTLLLYTTTILLTSIYQTNHSNFLDVGLYLIINKLNKLNLSLQNHYILSKLQAPNKLLTHMHVISSILLLFL